MNTLNATGAIISSTESVAAPMSGAIALNWSGSLFFSTLELESKPAKLLEA